MDKIPACVSCGAMMHLQNHQELVHPHNDIRIPLCDHCLEFPYRIDVSNVFASVHGASLHPSVERAILEAVMLNKTSRYQNPTPVIIGLILMELTETGGTLLAGKRSPSMKEYPGELALLSGYMEQKHGDWQGSLVAEGQEELAIEIDTSDSSLIIPGSFETAAKGRILLNWVTVLPGATTLMTFYPNDETVERHVIPFTWDNRPRFGIPQHNEILRRFCEERRAQAA